MGRTCLVHPCEGEGRFSREVATRRDGASAEETEDLRVTPRASRIGAIFFVLFASRVCLRRVFCVVSCFLVLA